MKLRWIQLVLVLLVASCATAAVDDASLDKAISASSDYLLKKIGSDGRIRTPYWRMQEGVVDALVAWSLAESPAVDATERDRILRRLSTKSSTRTSFFAFRILAFLDGNATLRKQLLSDGAWLIKAQNDDGGWGMAAGKPSNQLDTAFAMYAIMQAQQRGLVVEPKATWGRAAGYLARSQNPDGGFGYRSASASRLRSESHGSATAAGAVSLGVLVNRRSLYDRTKRDLESMKAATLPPEIGTYGQAISWLWKQMDLSTNPYWAWGDVPVGRYWLLAALAGDFLSPMRLVEYDLDLLLSKELLDSLNSDGSIGPASNLNESRVTRTACALIALSRARRPLLINKMTLGSIPLADYNDAANLLHYAERKLHIRGTWRRVSPNAPLSVLRRSPLLLITYGPGAILSRSTAKRIQEYVQNDGIVLIQPLCGSDSIREIAEISLHHAHNEYTVEMVGESNIIFQGGSDLKTTSLSSIGDKIQRSIYLMHNDFSGQWHKGFLPARREAFDLVSEVLRSSTRLNKGYKFTLPAAAEALTIVKPDVELDVAGWSLQRSSIMPRAIARMSNAMASAMSVGLKLRVITDGKLIGAKQSCLWIDASAGDLATNKFMPAVQWSKKTKGLLLFDVGGSFDRQTQLETMLEKRFSNLTFRTISKTHALMTGAFADSMGCDLRALDYGASAEQLHGQKSGLALLRGIYGADNRLVGVISTIDLLSTLSAGKPSGTTSYKITDDALSVALNLVLYSYLGQKDGL